MPEETTAADRSTLPTPEEALSALDELEYSDSEFDDLMSLYEDTMTNIQQGEIVEGTVLSIDDGTVVIDIGFKSEGSVQIDEFSNPEDIIPEPLRPTVPENLSGSQVWYAFCYVVPKSAVVAIGATRPEMDKNIRVGIREFWVQATKRITYEN